MSTLGTLDPEKIAACRQRIDHCRQSANGYEVREGEFWAPLLLAYDAAQDIAAHLYREFQKLRAEVDRLQSLLRADAERIAAQSELLNRRAERI